MNNSFYHENSHAWASSQFILRFFRQINIFTNSPHKFYSYIIFLRYFLLLLFSHEIMSIIFRENCDKKKTWYFFFQLFLNFFLGDFFFIHFVKFITAADAFASFLINLVKTHVVLNDQDIRYLIQWFFVNLQLFYESWSFKMKGFFQ